MPGPPVDLVDETFVVADRTLLARQISDPALWLEWWPDLRLSVVTDRGVDGIRWSVSGALSGTAEIWLEPWQDGVIVHWFLRAGLPPRGSVGSGSLTERECAHLRQRYATAFKRRIHALKDDLERGRPPGCPAGTADR
ncbi:MAG TPA: polyketide cyclase / dehydrase and lipid transport [Jiangellaceae bacterium]|nr:polyketide cyclase / dehydrase and lipid transport [Jiangellaceae bacterium]